MAMQRLQTAGGELLWRPSARFALACSDLPIGEVERRALAQECEPRSAWRLAKSWPDGEPNPKPCPASPETYRDYYFEHVGGNHANKRD